MTQAEHRDLYDSLYFGHEVELAFNGKKYYLESCENGYDMYLMGANHGQLVAHFRASCRDELLEKLFSTPIFDNKAINDAYNSLEIVAID